MMNPFFLNQTNAGYFDLNHDNNHQDQQQQVLENSPYFPPSIAASSISNLHLEQGLGMSSSHNMSDQSVTFDQLEVSPSYGAQMTNANNYGSSNHEIFIFKQREDQEANNHKSSGDTSNDNGSSLRWMSSKMRMMRKMIKSSNIKTETKNGSKIISSSNKDPDQGPQTVNSGTHNENNYGVRVCTDCNTTKTPLWRSGPQGPKTLCNACGIRQRKARKAAMEAAAAAVATNSSNEASSATSTKTTTIKLKISKEKNKSRAFSSTCVSQHINKKQTPCNKQQADDQLVDSDHNNSSSTSNSSKRQMIFEEFSVKFVSKNGAFHRMFPQDEEEGALLLMALSYGLIQS